MALIVAAEVSGLRARLSIAGLRHLTEAAGARGAILFVVLFCAGTLAYVPGTVFIVAALLSYGQLWGGALAWLGATLAVISSFGVVRSVGGTAPAEIKQKLIRRMLATLDARPLSTIFVLRVVFWTSPPINYALALSRVRFRDHALGSAVGLAVAIAAVALFTDRLLDLITRYT